VQGYTSRPSSIFSTSPRPASRGIARPRLQQATSESETRLAVEILGHWPLVHAMITLLSSRARFSKLRLFILLYAQAKPQARNPSAQLHFANEALGRLFVSVQLVPADDDRRIAIVIPSNLDVQSVNAIAGSGPSCRAKLFFCEEAAILAHHCTSLARGV
jgi:hypothetical protein